MKAPIDRAELHAHLAEQLQFLEASAASFDAGFYGEFKRLAVTIRVLVHDTQASHSLLRQLGMKDIKFTDTCPVNPPGNLMSFHGLAAVTFDSPKNSYAAMLDDVPPSELREVAFEEWWNKVICIDKNKETLSRRQLILSAANQDGGAHVDPALDSTYAELKKNSLGWIGIDASGANYPLEGAERASVRQIAHEVLKTLKSGYSKTSQHKAGGMISAVSITVANPQPMRRMEGKKLGRNDPCFCGSGKKYKRCHGV
jgi:hypothetical protein